MGNTFVNVNGTWMTKRSEHVNVNGTWLPSKSKYVNVNGAWMTVQDMSNVDRDLQVEYDSGRIRIYNHAISDSEQYIGRTISPTQLKGWSERIDNLPVFKLYYHAPSSVYFNAQSNYLDGRYEYAFGVSMFYIDTGGVGRSMVFGAFEDRNYYNWNQVNNGMSVFSKGPWAVFDEDHCTKTDYRVSTLRVNPVDTLRFNFNATNRTVSVNNHSVSLPSDFSYAYQFWITTFGWHSATVKTNIVMSGLRYV